MPIDQSYNESSQGACTADLLDKPRSILRVILSIVVSNILLGLAAHAQAMSGGHPFGSAPTVWREEDMDTLLSSQDAFTSDSNLMRKTE